MKVLSAHRSVIDGIIQFHEGRIINTAGDSVLAEFASPTQAVRCAVEIQDALKTRNDTLPEDRRMHFRIGVNLGDVMVKGDDLLGDGVNVAARLEGIAEPGHIYIASSVYDQIAGKLDLGFVDLGEQSLKNIDRPIRAYRVDRDSRRVTVAKRKSGTKPASWVAAALAAAALGAGVLWFQGQQAASRQEQSAKAKAAADAEIAKARAEAEEAKKTAAASADTAAAAQRALEEQRIAATRARAQAELSAARAEAEATRSKAQAELASASEARRAAETASKKAAAPATAAPSAGSTKWAGTFACGSIGTSPPAAYSAVLNSVGNSFELSAGKRGQPGWLQMTGIRRADGTLRLAGSGINRGSGTTYQATMEGRFTGEHYLGRGVFGTRDCSLRIVTEEAAAREAVALPGPWTANLACAAEASSPPAAFPMHIAVNGRNFELTAGKPGEPHSAKMGGRREAGGRMRITGKGISGMKESYGQAYGIEFDGKFASERYQGRGKLGARDCSLTIARR
jgi:hypothetical protein